VRAALSLSAAAVAVAAPALVLAFLEGDGIATSPHWRAALLSIRAIATALVLTGGAAYLAHAYATVDRARAALAACWVGAVACSAVLIAPAIVGGLEGTSLARVLTTSHARWGWAVAAVLGPDLVAAGAMLAASHRVGERVLERVSTPSRYLSLGLSTPSPGGAAFSPLPQPTPSPEPVAYPCPAGCGRSFDSQDRARGHLAQCPTRRAERAAKKGELVILERAEEPRSEALPERLGLGPAPRKEA
jgi:MFS family permease